MWKHLPKMIGCFGTTGTPTVTSSILTHTSNKNRTTTSSGQQPFFCKGVESILKPQPPILPPFHLYPELSSVEKSGSNWNPQQHTQQNEHRNVGYPWCRVSPKSYQRHLFPRLTELFKNTANKKLLS